jgi:hypothetical protein
LLIALIVARIHVVVPIVGNVGVVHVSCVGVEIFASTTLVTKRRRLDIDTTMIKLIRCYYIILLWMMMAKG